MNNQFCWYTLLDSGFVYYAANWRQMGIMMQFTRPEFRNAVLHCMAFMQQVLIQRVFTCQYKNRFILIKTKHSVHIMVFKVVTSNAEVFPIFIFPLCLIINTESYIKCLFEVVWFVWFYGISTIIGYLMPTPLYTYILNLYD